LESGEVVLSNDHDDFSIPVHHPIREDQPYVPQHGWTMGDDHQRAVDVILPHRPARSEFDLLVANARKLLADLDRVLFDQKTASKT
jgi:hypothetical protein